jgi:sterol 3beta-glucosyltransferase
MLMIRGIRVTKLEVGIKLGSLRAEEVANALRHATTDVVMIEKAARVGERIRAENGVENALQAIHFNIGRAASDRTKMTWAK